MLMMQINCSLKPKIIDILRLFSSGNLFSKNVSVALVVFFLYYVLKQSSETTL